MKLFFYKPKIFYPIIILVVKISSNEQAIKIESFAHELFQILLDLNEASEKSILILSIIKDNTKSTLNIIIPSTKSNINLVERCQKNIKFCNLIIADTLIKSDCEFYIELFEEIELIEEKVLIHPIKLNLMDLSNYYKTK